MERLVIVEVERRCNLRCGYCQAWKDQGAPNPFVTPDCFAQLTHFLRALGSRGYRHLAVTGGEPTLFPRLVQLVAEGTRMGLRTAILTNGVLLDQALADSLADAGLTEVFISLDGPSDQVNRMVRSLAATVTRGIRAARSAGIPVDINCVLTRVNLSDIPGLLELAREESCMVSAYPVYLPPDHPEHGRLHLGNLLPNERTILEDALVRLAAYDRERSDYYKFVHDTYLGGCTYALRTGCAFARAALLIRSDGDVYSCFHRPERYGNLLADDHDTIIDRALHMAESQQWTGCFGEHCYSLHADIAGILEKLEPVSKGVAR